MENAPETAAAADHQRRRADVQTPSAPSTRAVAAAVAGMGAAWLAAGSTGLLAHPLRHALTWVVLAVSIIAAWPPRQTWNDRLVLLAALVVAVAMIVPTTPVYNVLAVCLVLAMLARANRGLDGRLLLLAAFAAAVLGVYVLASTSIATVWSVADALGRALGRVATAVSGRPLAIGATFAGLDFLVLMAAVYVGWLGWTAPPRLGRAVWAALAILGGHLVYLAVLSCSMDLYNALPPAPPPPEFRDYIPPPWHWSDAARSLLPWNVPLVAGLIQLAVAATMFRWAAWLPATDQQVPKGEIGEHQTKRGKASRLWRRQQSTRGGRGRAKRAPGNEASGGPLRGTPATHPRDGRRQALTWAVIVLAILVPLFTTLAPGQSSLADRKIVACNQGYLDWEKPVHDRYGQASAGMYGMLPEFIASLGGRFERSDELPQEDLDGADVLLLIHPVGPWPENRLQRVREFVRNGGSLLVLTGTPVQEGEITSSYNEVLRSVLGPERIGMEVSFDAAVPVAWNWQDSYWPMAHAAVTGVEDGRNRFGMTQGPSIRLQWPARPVLVGRWGWGDPGIDAVLTRMYQYDAGEKLGDLVLAAEQPLGRGRVLVVSDASGFTNQGNVTSYVFTGRLLAYLATGAGNPQAAWRQALGLLGCLALVALMAWPLDPTRVAAVAVVLALALAGSRTFSHLSMRVLPDGREHAAYNNVAYIDSSHMEAYSDAGWGYDGVAGLALTLMRSGLEPYLLPELTSERLERAGMLISIAPARPFSWAEREAVHTFVQQGGIFICMVGADRAGPVQPLLERFDLRVPRLPVRPGEEGQEPVPMGHFRTLYRPAGADYDAGLLIYHGWPVECDPSDVLVRGFNNLPIIAARDVGRGKVVLVGDTAFAMNKNLEYVGGEPFDGRYDNAQFWRWLLTSLTGVQAWLPPPAERSEDGPAAEEETEDEVKPSPEDVESSGTPADAEASAMRATPDAPGTPAADAVLPRSDPFENIPIDEVAR